MLATATPIHSSSEVGAFAPVYEKLDKTIVHVRASGPMKHSDLEELLFKELLELGRLFYQAALYERGPGAVSEPVIDVDGQTHTDQRLNARRLMTRFGPVEITRVGYSLPGQESLHPFDAELNLPTELYSHSLRRLAA